MFCNIHLYRLFLQTINLLMRQFTLVVIFSIISSLVYSQNKFTISGYVQDNSSGENLIGVSIYEKKSFKGTSSNQYGFYSLSLDEGEYDIVFSFIGYKSITKSGSFSINLPDKLYAGPGKKEEVDEIRHEHDSTRNFIIK